MEKTILIGLGGTGARVVNNVVKEIHLNRKDLDDEDICCAILDTNKNDIEKIINSNTGVCVIPTSKKLVIGDYISKYHYRNIEEWCPQSPAFLSTSMIDGASEIRVKSRIAFMDCMESGGLKKLETMINNVLKVHFNSKIRIMIVSSVSGGTGSGMFIQVALWLRKILSINQVEIRGIFLLPDIFIRTIPDIHNNEFTKARHYCNAYAAIRELNALNKIIKSGSVELTKKINIDALFNSDSIDNGKPVFDYAFFVDDKDKNNINLDSIGEYERMVAQLVYMQLYAPMKYNLYSVEDNTFLTHISNEEPLYASCGTAKAVYPTESVKTYCAIRAAQDALKGGWKRIDNEINAQIEEKKQREKDGVFSNEAIDIHAQYIRLFDEKAAVRAEETGRDRFFLSISKDVNNEEKTKEEDRVITRYSDKASDFVELMKKEMIDVAVTSNSGMKPFMIKSVDDFVAQKLSESDLSSRKTTDFKGMERALDDFDDNVTKHADTIVNSVFPLSMGDVSPSNSFTIYGLLTKQDDNGFLKFIHPVATRYVLYKLVDSMESELKNIVLKESREIALSGGGYDTEFDNETTPKTEVTPEEYLDSKRWYQNREDFLNNYKRHYADFIAKKIGLCEQYEKESLQLKVYTKLIERVNGLIKQIETFFKELEVVQTKLDTSLTDNIKETNTVDGKTVYILGKMDDKEAIYRTLDLELDKDDDRINKSVIDAVYGSYCAEIREHDTANKSYIGIGVSDSFINDIKSAFRKKIDDDANNKKKVELDIYAALCRESDVDFRRRSEIATDDIDDSSFVDSRVSRNNAENQRHEDAFTALKDSIYGMAAPFLIYKKEVANNELGTVTASSKAFWGFAPILLDAYPFIEGTLGVNADLQKDDAYPKNELYCFRAEYGIEAAYIPKFNELKNGDYYKSYKAIIDEMVKDADGPIADRAYVSTPHLDKSWHKILPYITEEKEKQDELEFFHGFWLAIAYGAIKVGMDDQFFIRRHVDGGYGSVIYNDIAIKYKNKPVTKTEVAKLIEALRMDKVFTDIDIPEFEARFKEEIEDITTYVATDVLSGLTIKNDDLNPINIVTRFNQGRARNIAVTAALIGALEKIASELAMKYDENRTEKQLVEAMYRICRKIYDSSRRVKGKSEIFRCWEEAFEMYKTGREDGSTDYPADDSTDDSSM